MNDAEPTPEPTTNRLGSQADEPTVKDSAVSDQDRKAIGEYQLIRRIGGGGMGVVYEALHTRLKRRVAVKVISESYLSRDGALRRFFREMEAAGRLDHPHIVQATDAGVADGVPYLVMELVQGSNLSRIVRQFGALPPLAALEAIEQTAKALGHIHAHGMVHRDIKPSNLLLNDRGQLKVADLGLAHLFHPLSEDDDVTTTGDVIGTVDYMAPEQAHNSKLIDHRSDIYSLGCCLHFVVCGSPVFRAESHIERLLAHRSESVPELVACCGFPLPKSVNRLFQEMLAKNPARRPQSVAEVMTRLGRCRDDLQDAFARSAKKETRLVGSKPLPVDVGLETTARSLLAEGPLVDDDTCLKTTVQLRRRSRKDSYRNWIVAGCLAFFTVAALGAFLGREHLLSLANGAKPATPPVEPQKGDTEHSAAENEGPIAAPLKQYVLDAHPRSAVFNVHFSEDGQRIVSCGSDGMVRVWDIASKQRVGQMQHERGPNGLHVIDVALIPKTTLAVSVCFSGIATVWDWQKSQKHLQFEHHQNQVEGVAWIRGTHILTTGRDDAMYIWDAENGNMIARLENTHAGGVRAVSVHADGLRAVTADYNGALLLWNLEEGNEHFVDQLEPVNESIQIWSLDWVPGTDRIAIGGVYSSGESLLIVYDVVAHQVVHRFTQLTGRVYGVCPSRDGQRLFSAADTVQGWSLENATDKPLFEYTGHDDNVFSVDESPDGTLLATGGTDGTVRFFQWRQMLAGPGNADR
jgi:serine/threonine protein kinase/WD40 repeat protein